MNNNLILVFVLCVVVAHRAPLVSSKLPPPNRNANCDEDCVFDLLKKQLLRIFVKDNSGNLRVPLIEGSQGVWGFKINYELRDSVISDVRKIARDGDVEINKEGERITIKLRVKASNMLGKMATAIGSLGWFSFSFKNPRAEIFAVEMSFAIILDRGQSPCKVTFGDVATHATGVKITTEEYLPDWVKDQAMRYLDPALADAATTIFNSESGVECEPFLAIVADRLPH
ncbi:uncharacterized protein LOC106659604 [Trichogramma pretiosum]|uniref:uncharacterized protein LOC106659604 n=1 Tax=Trichogramma pretiosum TaxID=7493 RepID=UPI0006C9C2E8|nr:uncharacterized protein LOC106659604 [Trichogramma pretiosum]